MDGRYTIICQSVPTGKDLDRLSIIPGDTTCPEPYQAIRIALDGPNAVTQQPIRGGEIGEFLPIVSVDTVVHCPKPQRAIWSAVDSGSHFQIIFTGQRPELFPIVAPDAVHLPEPHGAIRGAMDGEYLAPMKLAQFLPIVAKCAIPSRPKPDGATGVAFYGRNFLIRQFITASEIGKLSVPIPGDATLCPKPQDTKVITMDGSDIVIRQPIPCGDIGECPLIVPGEAASSPKP